MSARSSLPAARTIQTALGPVACIVAGRGPPVLALHGGMGGADQSWILAQALFTDASAFRIVAMARPGYVGTRLSGGTTPEQQAALQSALLDALGIERVTVAAISAGGPSAIHFAARYPARCDRLVLVSAASGPMQAPPVLLARLKQMAILACVPGVLSYLRRKVAANPAAAASRLANPALAAALDHPVVGPLLRQFQQSVFTGFRARLPGTRNDIARLAVLPPLPLGAIRAPVLAIHGGEDFVVPPAHARAVAAALPDARVLMLPGGGHEVLFTHLDAVRAAVAGFLR
jgi:pimeloyl-ACP methyl ester carboxylesterase